MFKKKLLFVLLMVFGLVGLGANVSYAEENQSDPSYEVIPEALDGSQFSPSTRAVLRPKGYGHVQNLGNIPIASLGSSTYRIGTTGKGKNLEGFTLSIPGFWIEYESHVQNIGWQGSKANGVLSGTTGRGLRIEAIAMSLKHPGFGVRYRVHIRNIGWTGWTNEGLIAGTTGQGKAIEAIDFKFYPKPR